MRTELFVQKATEAAEQTAGDRMKFDRRITFCRGETGDSTYWRNQEAAAILSTYRRGEVCSAKPCLVYERRKQCAENCGGRGRRRAVPRELRRFGEGRYHHDRFADATAVRGLCRPAHQGVLCVVEGV